MIIDPVFDNGVLFVKLLVIEYNDLTSFFIKMLEKVRVNPVVFINGICR